MPRGARELSSSGVYHVMARGIRRENIFHDDSDRRTYLRLLAQVKDEFDLLVYGFCLMENHVHILLKEGTEPLGASMKRIGVSYAVRFNQKYNRTGYLFQGRFRSEPVEDDPYFLTVLRYIHQNPVKAGVTPDCASYPWSSYRNYAARDQSADFVDTEFALELLGGRQQFLAFTNAANNDSCLEVADDPITDEELRGRLEVLVQQSGANSLEELSSHERKEVLRQLKLVASIRQINRATGVGKAIVERA